MRPTSVFISYSSRDRREAFAVKQLLESHQIKVWLDFFDIRTTAELASQLSQRVQDAEVFCLLLSPTAVQSAWVHKEIDSALSVAKNGLRILPIILRPCQIPLELSNIVGVDATDGLENEAVRLRLVRAIAGHELIEDRVLLDSANRLLLANKEVLLKAEEDLPDVAEKIAASASQPFRKATIVIHPETLPEDPSLILEIRLSLDTLFHSHMSFFIARYREGTTWPSNFTFDEPPYTEFYLSDQPKLDVWFKWFNRELRLTPHMDGTDLKTLPAIFELEFDGASFKPEGEFNLPQDFEIPSLTKLDKMGSHIALIAHDPVTKSPAEIPEETDIDLELRGEAGDQSLCLFQSHTTSAQRIILSSQFLATISNSIRSEAILNRYTATPARQDRRPEIYAAREKGEYESDDVRRLAARLSFSDATLARFQTRHRDAYKLFQQTAEILQPLVFVTHTNPQDASLIFRACRSLVDIWLRQESFQQASQLADTLIRAGLQIVNSDPTQPDYQRMWAEALLVSAHIQGKLGRTPRACEELTEHVEIFEKLHRELPSPARREAFLKALANAVRLAKEWQTEADLPVEAWNATLAAELGEPHVQRLTHIPSPEELPFWLQPSNPKGWPTKPQASNTLRYSLRIPERWNTDPEVRGTAREVEHIYRGRESTEWLIVSFMERANAESNMTLWVDTLVSMSRFPVLTGNKVPPELRQWNYLGRMPAVAQKLHSDEAHAYTGTALYIVNNHPVLGRLYIMMIRRQMFAWKFALSIETACLEGSPEDRIASQDHSRAGAIFGSLSLDDK